MEKIEKYLVGAEELILLYGSKIVLAIIVLVVGLWLISKFTNMTHNMMKKRGMDASLQPFLRSILNIMFKIVLIISVISILGVETTSFIAVLGSAGLAIGLALQGSLSNFAGGVILLSVKPFKVGDYITAMGTGGTVDQINILNTILKTPDNQKVYIPNGKLASDVITNFSEEDTRRLVLTFGIHYNDDIAQAKNIIQNIVESDERVLKEPAPSIVVAQLADNSVNIDMRIWVKSEDFWTVKFFLTEKVKTEFDKEKITIPYPQRDLHLYQHQELPN